MSNRLRKLYYVLPPAWRYLAREVYYAPVDWYEKITGKRHPLAPPKGKIFTGSGDYIESGRHVANLIVEHTGLAPNGAVLEIGSGMGRIAVGLTQYLSEEGNYQGFDPIKKGVDWCEKNITKRFPNFEFTYTPLKNDLYRNDGAAPEAFRFPYADNSFDVVFANSVFTHMVGAEVERYFAEAKRVLKQGGKLYGTFFILNPTTEAMTADREFRFDYSRGNYSLMDEQVESANVAYQEGYLRDQLARNNFSAIEIHEGYWRGIPKEETFEFQDVVVATAN